MSREWVERIAPDGEVFVHQAKTNGDVTEIQIGPFWWSVEGLEREGNTIKPVLVVDLIDEERSLLASILHGVRAHCDSRIDGYLKAEESGSALSIDDIKTLGALIQEVRLIDGISEELRLHDD